MSVKGQMESPEAVLLDKIFPPAELLSPTDNIVDRYELQSQTKEKIKSIMF